MDFREKYCYTRMALTQRRSKIMKRPTFIEHDDGLEQMRRESVALRKDLGLPGGRLTEEQQRVYLEAKQRQRLDKNTSEMSKQST